MIGEERGTESCSRIEEVVSIDRGPENFLFRNVIAGSCSWSSNRTDKLMGVLVLAGFEKKPSSEPE